MRRVVRHKRTGELFDVILTSRAFVVLRSHVNGDVFSISTRDFATFVSMTHPSVRIEP